MAVPGTNYVFPFNIKRKIRNRVTKNGAEENNFSEI